MDKEIKGIVFDYYAYKTVVCSDDETFNTDNEDMDEEDFDDIYEDDDE